MLYNDYLVTYMFKKPTQTVSSIVTEFGKSYKDTLSYSLIKSKVDEVNNEPWNTRVFDLNTESTAARWIKGMIRDDRCRDR